jgi:hypothetical protein
MIPAEGAIQSALALEPHSLHWRAMSTQNQRVAQQQL